jgi:hypothetical protein
MNAVRSHDGPSIADVADMLAERAEAFCRDHLRGGIKSGGRWRCGDIHGNTGQSVSVVLTGPKAGRWKDFSADVQGDMIDLLCANQGLNKGEAFKRAKEWLGISDATGHASVARHAEAREKKRVAIAAAVTEDEHRKQLFMTTLVRSAREATNTVVHAYLRGRGITIAPPAGLLLLPLHEHKPSGRQLPCMIAPVYAPRMAEGEDKAVMKRVALHRTWLSVTELEARVSAGQFVLEHHVLALTAAAEVARLKFPVNGHDTGKMALGPMRGGCIPLTASPTKSTLAITEGIENGLSIAQVNPGWSVWAAYSASNFANLIIPNAVSRLILCGDADNKPARGPDGAIKTHDDGSAVYPAEEALKRAAQLHADVSADEGRALTVEIWRPAPGKDANDMLREGTL